MEGLNMYMDRYLELSPTYERHCGGHEHLPRSQSSVCTGNR